jgi:hypothetical protein
VGRAGQDGGQSSEVDGSAIALCGAEFREAAHVTVNVEPAIERCVPRAAQLLGRIDAGGDSQSREPIKKTSSKTGIAQLRELTADNLWKQSSLVEQFKQCQTLKKSHILIRASLRNRFGHFGCVQRGRTHCSIHPKN